MKKFLTLAVLAITLSRANTQIVANGDFEAHSACPTMAGQISLANGWGANTGATVDYFNRCGSADYSVPSNIMGHQDCWKSAYAGLPTFVENSKNQRLITTLAIPLEAGHEYTFSADLSLAERSGWSSDINIRFYRSAIDSFPQLINLSGPTDTASWTTLTATFTADDQFPVLAICGGGLQWHVGDDTTFAYYYIDNVAITELTAIDQSDLSDPVVAESFFNLLGQPMAEIHGAALIRREHRSGAITWAKEWRE